MTPALFMEDEPEEVGEELFAVHFRAGRDRQDFYVIDYQPERKSGPVHWGTWKEQWGTRKFWPRSVAEEIMAEVIRDYLTPGGSRYDGGAFSDLRLVPAET